MKEIARLANVSLGTVSNVLSGLPSVDERLRKRVMKAVDALGYQPNQLSRGLRKNKTNIIGIIISDVSNPFFLALVRGAEDTAFKNGYRLFLCNSANDFTKEETYLRELKTYLPSGLIILTTDIGASTRLADAYQAAGTAVVYVDRLPDSWKGDTITSMNEAGSYEAAKLLIDRGHRRIAMIGGPSGLTNSGEREAGYRRAMKEAGLRIPKGFVQEAAFDKESGVATAKVLLSLPERPTAIFAANDLLAFGAMHSIRAAGLRCPEDVSVVGFDNLDLAEFVTPTLTSVDQSVYKLGAVAAQMVIDRVRGDQSPRQQCVLPTILKIRESVGTAETSSVAKRQPARTKS